MKRENRTPKFLREEKSRFADDEFSKELKRQGEDGKLMRKFYLWPWPAIYQKRVQDESLHD